MKLSICIDILFFGQDFIPALEKVKAIGFDHYVELEKVNQKWIF